MFRFRYFKKFILPMSVSGAAVGASGSGDSEFETGKKTRPSDLPLYSEPDGGSKKQEDEVSRLQGEIAKVREEVWVWYDSVKGYREKVVEVVVTAKEHSEALIGSLRNDELPVPRSGAIAISGLAGFILGLRGGWFKRILYGSTCAGIMAAVCYPKETKEVTQEALAEAKKYVLISYNFIYGVKPDNLKLPSPSDILGSSVKVSKDSVIKKDEIPPANIVSEKEASETSSSVRRPTPPPKPPFPPIPPPPPLPLPNAIGSINPAPPTADSSSHSRLPMPAKEENERKKTPRQNDQSNPADKDLYSNRK